MKKLCRAKDCEKEGKFGRCGNCKLHYYCSRECQKLEWERNHRDFCTKHTEEELKYEPKYTDDALGPEQEDDLVIVYSRYKYLKNELKDDYNPKYNEAFIIQWFLWNPTVQDKAVSISTTDKHRTPICPPLHSYLEMQDYALICFKIRVDESDPKGYDPEKYRIRNILFCHHTSLLVLEEVPTHQTITPLEELSNIM